ncbi:hypothetical protein B0T22DRAFT_256867 [Podospora appendiculata]|uniref:Uncharacterized protein n=1 Tax=Podospora appendiculata TaxID=314037 RepID=A0AAE0X2V1_9PEZI|nr:hypothetical protein B0T22DRAFT_256867 [Podospora appendiculata]
MAPFTPRAPTTPRKATPGPSDSSALNMGPNIQKRRSSTRLRLQKRPRESEGPDDETTSEPFKKTSRASSVATAGSTGSISLGALTPAQTRLSGPPNPNAANVSEAIDWQDESAKRTTNDAATSHEGSHGPDDQKDIRRQTQTLLVEPGADDLHHISEDSGPFTSVLMNYFLNLAVCRTSHMTTVDCQLLQPTKEQPREEDVQRLQELLGFPSPVTEILVGLNVESVH